MGAAAQAVNGIPLDTGRVDDSILALERNLRARVVGQDQAVRPVVQAFQATLAGLSSPSKPRGSFLFLGPTGTGKTRLAEAVTESLVESADSLIRIDCAEYYASHDIAKIIGSPPGYTGHRETEAYLSQSRLNSGWTDKVKLSFVLFDEIEKASYALWNLLLGILDKARLTTGDNKTVDFSRCFIFMTSNCGAREMTEASFGFGGPSAALPDSASLDRVAQNAARKKFSPEFLNRIDHVTTFRPLELADLRRILQIELYAVQMRIFKADVSRPFLLGYSDAALDFLLADGADIRFGARHIKRAIERRLVQPLSNLISTGQIGDRDWIYADAGPEGLLFSKSNVPRGRVFSGLE